MMEASGARMQGGHVSMTELTKTLSLVLGRPVIDKSGFTGTFDVQLDFTPDLATAGLPGRPPAADPTGATTSADFTNPTILSAVQKLGLKLESSRDAVELLVIDHVERPSAN